MRNLPASCGKAACPASRIAIIYRRIDQLKPDPGNPRLHSKNKSARSPAASKPLASMFQYWWIPISM